MDLPDTGPDGEQNYQLNKLKLGEHYNYNPLASAINNYLERKKPESQKELYNRIPPELSAIKEVTRPKSLLEKTQGFLGDVAGEAFGAVREKPLETAFDLLSPLALYTPEAEGSPTGSAASKLAQLFNKWYTGGQVTVNVPGRKLKEILSDPDNKLKNQMELTSKSIAWDDRLRVEEKLAGIPKPQRGLNIFNPKFWIKNTPEEARKHPIYGHVYNPEFQDARAANMFGNTYFDMNHPAIRENSRYVIGDSFYPTWGERTTFSHADMSGQTNKLERTLFDEIKKMPDITKYNTEQSILHPAPYGKTLDSSIIPPHKGQPFDRLSVLPNFIEAWIPNELSTLKNVKKIVIPELRDTYGIQSTIKGAGTARGLDPSLQPFVGSHTPNSLRKLFELATP